MRKNISSPVFAVAGAIALVVGLAENAHAIPDSISSWIPGGQQSDYDAVRSIGHDPAGSSSIVTVGTDLSENSSKSRRYGSWNFDTDGHGEATASTLPGKSGTPVGVPDGGATAMMLGGALCGLAFLSKKLKV